MSKDTREIGGHLQFRRFAYLCKDDRSVFGLLEAVDYKNARKHLGSRFHIRQTWLSQDEMSDGSERRKWEIVASIFLGRNSVAEIE